MEVVMRSTYSGSPAAAFRSLIDGLVGSGWPTDEAERRVRSLVPVLAVSAPESWARRRRRLERDGAFDAEHFRRVVALYGRCLRCGRDDVNLVSNHVIPLRRGGEHHVRNIQPLCPGCNRWKGLRMIDFRAGHPRLEDA
jgi:5-methylcytosine-specific restriction endonuclease McrA